MRSRLCILKTVKPLKMILDSAMASKMKNIYHKKTSLFDPADGLHPKKTSWSREETKPFSLQNFCYKNSITKFTLQNLR